jgi:hypothetical protein
VIRIALASFLFLAACAKVDDLGHLQEEGVAAAKSYTPKLDDLQHRADSVLARGAEAARGSDPTETTKARATLDRAIQLIGDMRSKSTVAASEIQTAAKSGSYEEVERKIDDLRHHMHTGIIEANDDLDAVENWLALAETQAKVSPVAPEPPDTNEPEPPSGETPTETPAPAGEPPKADAPKPADAKPAPKQPADAKQPAPKQPDAKQPPQPRPPQPKAPAAPKSPAPPKQG